MTNLRGKLDNLEKIGNLFAEKFLSVQLTKIKARDISILCPRLLKNFKYSFKVVTRWRL